ncbi:MAG: fasciclin domain-containing protein [Acidimicrobiia bacterium]|nr:fasciclin domain-containing protein [Acidimicrobiia bacterium]
MDDDDEDEDDGDDEEAADDTIVDVAVGAGSFTILVDLVTEAGLADTLATEELTVFAPTDEAFEALPPEVLEAVGNDVDLLTSILTYHVVAGTVLSGDVVELDGQTVETLSGASFTIEVDGETVTIIDGAGVSHEVVDVDVMASNGVIHVLNSVLLPEALDL